MIRHHAEGINFLKISANDYFITFFINKIIATVR